MKSDPHISGCVGRLVNIYNNLPLFLGIVICCKTPMNHGFVVGIGERRGWRWINALAPVVKGNCVMLAKFGFERGVVRVASKRWVTLHLPILLIVLIAAAQPAQAGAYKGIFTGLFYGQGEGCWGALFIRTKTIEWSPGDASCQRTTYTVIDKTMHTPFQNYDHIVFRLHHLSHGCPFHYIGLYYYLPRDELRKNGKLLKGVIYYQWSVVGFENYKQYKNFPYRGFENNSINMALTSLTYCVLPYSGKPFPYGKPLD